MRLRVSQLILVFLRCFDSLICWLLLSNTVYHLMLPGNTCLYTCVILWRSSRTCRYSTCTWALYDAAIIGSNHWVLLAFITNAPRWVQCRNPHLASMIYECMDTPACATMYSWDTHVRTHTHTHTCTHTCTHTHTHTRTHMTHTHARTHTRTHAHT